MECMREGNPRRAADPKAKRVSRVVPTTPTEDPRAPGSKATAANNPLQFPDESEISTPGVWLTHNLCTVDAVKEVAEK